VQDGVAGGVSGGAKGGAIVTYRSGATVSSDAAPQSFRLTGITVAGLSDQARDELFATLPVHEGDALIPQDLEKTAQAVKAFDEHLAVRWILGPNGSRTLQITAPGAIPAPPPPPADAMSTNPPGRIKVGGNVQSAMIVSKAPPVYPELAKSARVQGVVHLAVIIAKDGTVQEIHSLGGPAMLIQAAMDAVKQWVYKPTLLNGEPVNVETTVDVNFTLNQ
jgi:TonB family protein